VILIDLTTTEYNFISEYLDEIDELIEEDDGTFFPLPFLTTHSQVKKMLRGTNYEDS